MLEIKFVGTGGQGSVVAAKLLADAAVRAGYNAQSFASYGALRRGGQVESYVRLSDGAIRLHSKMYQPNYLILMNDSLAEDPALATKKGSTVLINSAKPSPPSSSPEGCNLMTIDANRIALDKGLILPSGMPIINTTVLGAVVGLIPWVEIDHLIEALREGKIPNTEKNIEAARQAHDTIKARLAGTIAVEAEAKTGVASVVTERYPQYQTKMPPCVANCPAGEDIERTAYFIQYQQFEKALENIKAENPFPGICGRVCFHPCETHCNRNQYDEGVATNALERAAFDYADAAKVTGPNKRASTGQRVAIIGSGPAGMTCAYYAAMLGHEVTIFEAQPVAGGVPRFGIPEYRLPRTVVDREIGEVVNLGIDVRLSTRVGKDIGFDDITREYDACFIAVGAHSSSELDIPGEGSHGVISGLDFLKRVNSGGEVAALGIKVAVIGGGNTAIDAARTARRLGAKEVTLVYRRSAEEMPAFKEEVAAAEREGIRLLYLATPVEIHSDGNRVFRLECVKTRLGGKDENGRRRPEVIAGSNFMLDVDTVIVAVGETLEASFLPGSVDMAGPVIRVDQLGRTSLARVFAGGDATSLSRSVVKAIASGKRAALGIDLLLRGRDAKVVVPFFTTSEGGATYMKRYLVEDYARVANSVVSFEDLNTAHFTRAPRLMKAELPVEARISNFDETDLGLSRAEAIAEAERCFHCGYCTMCEICYIFCPDLAISLDSGGTSFTIDEKVCKVCGICVRECPRNAISVGK